MAGKRGVRLNPAHDERTRAKIQTSQIINRLTQFVNGEVEMSAAQVTAGLGLLRKTLPDLSATEYTGTLEVKRASELSDEELAAIATGSGSRTADAEDVSGPSGSVH